MNILANIVNETHKLIYQKFSLSTPFDIVGFGKALGISIKESSQLPAKISGFIKKVDNEIAICVNKYDSLARKRFTVAHELGHFFLHHEKLEEGIVDALNRDGTIDQMENDANNFAANVLMPEMMFRELWSQQNCSIEYMAQYFHVSESAIMTRARFLDLAKEYSGYFA